jgi:hypothetical protein
VRARAQHHRRGEQPPHQNRHNAEAPASRVLT